MKIKDIIPIIDTNSESSLYFLSIQHMEITKHYFSCGIHTFHANNHWWCLSQYNYKRSDEHRKLLFEIKLKDLKQELNDNTSAI